MLAACRQPKNWPFTTGKASGGCDMLGHRGLQGQCKMLGEQGGGGGGVVGGGGDSNSNRK